MTLSGPIKVGHDQSPILFTINGVRRLVSIGSAQKNFAHDPERRRRRRYPPGTTCAWTSRTRSARPRPSRSIVCQRAPTVAAGERVLSKKCNETFALRLCVSKGRPAASSAFGLPMTAPIFRVAAGQAPPMRGEIAKFSVNPAPHHLSSQRRDATTGMLWVSSRPRRSAAPPWLIRAGRLPRGRSPPSPSHIGLHTRPAS